jgi:hypothetical protein
VTSPGIEYDERAIRGTAVRAKEHKPRPRCPSCSSVRLVQDYWPELGDDHAGVMRCRACGWDDAPEDLDLAARPRRDFPMPEKLSDFTDVETDEDDE